MRGSQVEGTRHVNSRIVNWNLFPLKRSDSEVHVSLSLSVRCRATLVPKGWGWPWPWIMGVCFVVLAQQVLAVVVAIRRPDDRVDVPARVGHAPPPPREWPRSALLPQHHDRQENCERDSDRLGEHHQAAARKPVGGLLPGGTTALGLSSSPEAHAEEKRGVV